MRSSMECFTLNQGRLVRVDSKVAAADDYRDALAKAGYVRELSSQLDDCEGAQITVYSTRDEAHPAFFIELDGATGSMGYFQADTLPHLVETLTHLSPLVQLIGLEQRAWIRTLELVEAEAARNTARRSG